MTCFKSISKLVGNGERFEDGLESSRSVQEIRLLRGPDKEAKSQVGKCKINKNESKGEKERKRKGQREFEEKRCI